MKRAILIFFVILSSALSAKDVDCVWTYRCCEHQEINGEVQCVTMCEPEIHCPETSAAESTDDDLSAALLKKDELDLDTDSRGSFFGVTICKKGYQMRNGKCQRIFSQPLQAIETSFNSTE